MLMSKFQEPEVLDPQELKIGDQVACHEAGNRLQLITGGHLDSEHGLDEIWMTLFNEPGETEHVWGEPVPAGNVALQIAQDQWRIAVLPQVLARRRIA